MSTVKPKRGRKAKKEEESPKEEGFVEENTIQMVFQEDVDFSQEKADFAPLLENDVDFSQEKADFAPLFPKVDVDIPKKRGRKPKGGKIIQQVVATGDNKVNKPNVILHLKCSLKDIHFSTSSQSNIQSFNFDTNKSDLSYEIISNNENPLFQKVEHHHRVAEGGGPLGRGLCPSVDQKFCSIFSKESSCCDEEQEDDYKKDNELKEVWKKLKSLEHNLHVNNICDKKSACFWCTYEFDNPPIYIPKSYMKETYNVYGCFCSPECAVAHLMEENIDSSARFERYHMINHIYTKVYNYKKNIKPAPNPYYMLDKFYGNLSIQEYRSLLRNERLFLIVDKPLTRILPELHEDNDDFIINNKIIPSNTYQIKKKVQRKQQSKNTILNEKFGF